jgi:hypothetical protein
MAGGDYSARHHTGERQRQDDGATSHRIDVINFLSHRKASFGIDGVADTRKAVSPIFSELDLHRLRASQPLPARSNTGRKRPQTK